MAHTFDVRFMKAAGLAASLQVDPAGISLTRRALMFFRRTLRIRAADIQQVFREGESLRVEYARAGSSRGVLPIWARDRDTAARIVALLPTTRTFEVEANAKAPRPKSRARKLGLLAFGVGGVVLGVLLTLALLNREYAAAPATAADAAGPRTPATAAGAEVADSPVASDGARRGTSWADYVDTGRSTAERRRSAAASPASSPATASGDTAASNAPVAKPMSEEMKALAAYAATSPAHTRVAPDIRPMRGGIVAIIPGDEVYVTALWWMQKFDAAEYSGDWSELTEQIYLSESFTHRDLTGMRETMLGVSRARRGGNHEFADRLTQQLRYYVY